MADSGEMTPGSVEAGWATPRAGATLRVSLATVMVAVLASAAGAAMFTKVYRLLGEGEDAVDVGALLLIGVALTAVAIGGWRRSSPAAVLLQMTVCFAFIVGMLEVAERAPRVFRYTLQIWFALMIALPMALRWLAGTDATAEPRRPRLLVLSELLLSCGVNLSLVTVGMWIQVTILFNFF